MTKSSRKRYDPTARHRTQRLANMPQGHYEASAQLQQSVTDLLSQRQTNALNTFDELYRRHRPSVWDLRHTISHSLITPPTEQHYRFSYTRTDGTPELRKLSLVQCLAKAAMVTEPYLQSSLEFEHGRIQTAAVTWRGNSLRGMLPVLNPLLARNVGVQNPTLESELNAFVRDDVEGIPQVLRLSRVTLEMYGDITNWSVRFGSAAGYYARSSRPQVEENVYRSYAFDIADPRGPRFVCESTKSEIGIQRNDPPEDVPPILPEQFLHIVGFVLSTLPVEIPGV